MNYRKFLGIGFLLISQIVYAQFGQSDLVKIKLSQSNWKVDAGSQFKIVLNASIKESWHINSNKPNDDFLIASKVTAKNDAVILSNINYPKPQELKLEFSEKPVSVFGGDIKIELTFTVNKNTASGKYSIPVKLSYQACNDQTCMPPTEVSEKLSVEVVGAAQDVKSELSNVKGETGEVKSETRQTSGGQASNVKSEKKEDNSIASTLESSGLFLSLFFVFIGGLALNLTPCVYPLIPITIGYFGGQSEGRTSRLFLLGILYVLGMAITYSVIGVVTSLSGAVFGTLLQNSFVIIGIAVLFVVLALSQFGVYEFKLPDSWVAKAGGAKGGAFGAFFMGLTMGIVAAPCIGPFVLGLVTYVAAKGDPFYGFLMFFVMAVGLGFPYLLLALFSGKIKKLPRAGDWMEGVKHIFGFLLLGMAIYFAAPLLPKELNKYLLPIFGILSAIFLLFIDKMANNVKAFRIFKIVFSLIVIGVSIYALFPSKNLEPEWQKFSEVKYEQSLKNNERMVIDFYADWCIPCKELDALTFSDSRVLGRMEKFTSYKVDMTKTLSDETEVLRTKFKIIGMPTVLIINAKGEEVERLTGFVNADEFLKILNKVN
ncbi:MAG: protein-disulfide reductase DsbD [Melioribacter sp.]|nr:protein-disulfide reductase DsbD [Melioribacter sp.]